MHRNVEFRGKEKHAMMIDEEGSSESKKKAMFLAGGRAWWSCE
jgi:hypothetical protein